MILHSTQHPLQSGQSSMKRWAAPKVGGQRRQVGRRLGEAHRQRLLPRRQRRDVVGGGVGGLVVPGVVQLQDRDVLVSRPRHHQGGVGRVVVREAEPGQELGGRAGADDALGAVGEVDGLAQPPLQRQGVGALGAVLGGEGAGLEGLDEEERGVVVRGRRRAGRRPGWRPGRRGSVQPGGGERPGGRARPRPGRRAWRRERRRPAKSFAIGRSAWRPWDPPVRPVRGGSAGPCRPRAAPGRRARASGARSGPGEASGSGARGSADRAAQSAPPAGWDSRRCRPAGQWSAILPPASLFWLARQVLAPIRAAWPKPHRGKPGRYLPAAVTRLRVNRAVGAVVDEEVGGAEPRPERRKVRRRLGEAHPQRLLPFLQHRHLVGRRVGASTS